LVPSSRVGRPEQPCEGTVAIGLVQTTHGGRQKCVVAPTCFCENFQRARPLVFKAGPVNSADRNAGARLSGMRRSVCSRAGASENRLHRTLDIPVGLPCFLACFPTSRTIPPYFSNTHRTTAGRVALDSSDVYESGTVRQNGRINGWGTSRGPCSPPENVWVGHRAPMQLVGGRGGMPL